MAHPFIKITLLQRKQKMQPLPQRKITYHRPRLFDKKTSDIYLIYISMLQRFWKWVYIYIYFIIIIIIIFYYCFKLLVKQDLLGLIINFLLNEFNNVIQKDTRKHPASAG